MNKLLIVVASVGAFGSPLLNTGSAEVSAQQSVTAEPRAGKHSGIEQFLVAGMDCTDCAKHAMEVLKNIPEVYRAEVVFNSKQATIEASRRISKNEVRQALGTLGLEARFSGDLVIHPLSEEEKVGLDIKTASRGEDIQLQDHLAPGKTTIFDYYADWCGPCQLLSPKLERLLLKYKHLALRKVDIRNWETKAAKQATKAFGLPGLPYVRIYGPKGKVLGVVHGNHIEKIEEIIARSQKL